MAKHSARKKIRKSKVKPRAVNPREPSRPRDEVKFAIDEKELARRIRDARDPTRYMIVSELALGMIFYYDVAQDAYVRNDAEGGTLFKRKEAAESVARLLSPGVSIAKFSLKNGKLKRISPIRPRDGS